MGFTTGRAVIFVIFGFSVVAAAILVLSMSLGYHNSHQLHTETEQLMAPPFAHIPLEKSRSQRLYESAVGRYRSAAVTTDTIPCSKVGTDILSREGATAVDAAIAAMFCVGVVNTHSSGIGGGHFMTIYDTPRDSDEKVLATIVARETAPLASHRDMFVNNTEASTDGGLAIAVPGEVKGFYEAWKMFGRIPWADLVQPTIDICEDGFEVEASLASAIRQYEDVIRNDPNLSEIFVKEDGSLMQEGDIMTRPKLAVTLERVAEDPEDFYFGELADDIVADIAEYDGIITKEDLEIYPALVKDALNVSLYNGDFTAYGVRPPSSGSLVLFITNVLDGYYFDPDSIKDIETAGLTYHRIAEAFKFAFARRSDLGDEDYVDVVDLLANLTSKDYAEGIRDQINDTHTQDVNYYGPSFDWGNKTSTAHANVIAPDGGCVAITATINLYFGSNVCGSRTGIIFNNEMDDFSTPGTENSFGVPASPANYIEPGKRPLSSMNPTIIVKDGEPVLLSGAAGGTRITSSTSFVAMQHIWFGLDILNATDTPRFHHQLVPNTVYHERHMSTELLEEFEAREHELTDYGSIGVVLSIAKSCENPEQFPDRCIVAVSDGRKGGEPDGF